MVTVVEKSEALPLTLTFIIRHRVGANAPPDDRLQRMIQCSATYRLQLTALEYWDCPRSRAMTAVVYSRCRYPFPPTRIKSKIAAFVGLQKWSR